MPAVTAMRSERRASRRTGRQTGRQTYKGGTVQVDPKRIYRGTDLLCTFSCNLTNRYYTRRRAWSFLLASTLYRTYDLTTLTPASEGTEGNEKRRIRWRAQRRDPVEVVQSSSSIAIERATTDRIRLQLLLPRAWRFFTSSESFVISFLIYIPITIVGITT